VTGYVISKDFPSSDGQAVTVAPFFATTPNTSSIAIGPERSTPVLHHAKTWRERRHAVAVLHAGGWHRHGWRVENARRYREAGQ